MTCDAVSELLLDYVEGGLSSEQAQAVQAHLDECPACAAKCRETRALVGDLSAARSVQEDAWRSHASQPPPAQPAPLSAGSVIGDFEILAELGRGGMGVVYRARQLSLNRVVALKVLATAAVQSERGVTRFAREAQAAARLHHTNIVPIYAQGREGGHFFYAMELIEGESLDRVLRRQRASPAAQAAGAAGPRRALKSTRRLSSPVSLLRSAASAVRLSGVRPAPPFDHRRIARLIAGVAEGLHHAHEQGVVHRDIKPQNLMLGRDDELHITDFGLARLLDEPGLTLSTELVGTPAYMAREQITGKQPIDRRTDVYALGVTLYELLTLERPFQGETYEQTINQILNREPRPPRKLDPRIPADLETICLRALEKEPQRRFATAADMARDLRRYAEGFPIASRPIGPVGKAVRWVRRHPWRASATAAAALLVIIIPLTLSFLNTAANAEIERAFDVLRKDYRDRNRALAELGWASRLAGNDYRYDLVQAFAQIRPEPERSIEILERLVAARPNDPDTHYLLAWACARRAQTQGVEMWSDVQRHVAIADALDVEPSADGWFFRGQAVWGFDPREAESTFDRAIDARDNFTQAMLHQCRAMNQIMYCLRDISYYQKAVTRLGFVVRSQSAQAYPRYLLSLTHLMAAEIYRDSEPAQLDRAEEAYRNGLAAALEAQRVEPSSPRGYAAEANIYESRGEFERAIAAWNHLDRPAVADRASPSDRSERSAYQMRLHFWLGQYVEAEQMRQQRYGPPSGYDPRRRYDADETLYEALLAASASDLERARRALARGVARADGRPECLLRLDAASRLLGQPPAELLVAEPLTSYKLSPGWTPDWLATLIRYQRDQCDWDALLAAAHAAPQRDEDPRLRLAGAYFFRGIRALAGGHRAAAIEAFQAARDRFDNENYSFRAEFFLVKLQRDPSWPSWRGPGHTRSPR
jgi:serine/threonine protein kinase